MKRAEKCQQAEFFWREERRTLTLEGEPVLTLSLRWPEVSGDGRYLRRFNIYYSRLAQVLRRRWERQGYLHACLELCACREKSRPFHPWKVTLDGRVEEPEPGRYAVQMDAREIPTNGRPICARDCGLWDLSQGVPLTLGQVLGRRVWRRTLLKRIKDAADQQASVLFLDADYPRKLEQHFCGERFFLSTEGVEVFYPQCTIAPGVEGIIALCPAVSG